MFLKQFSVKILIILTSFIIVSCQNNLYKEVKKNTVINDELVLENFLYEENAKASYYLSDSLGRYYDYEFSEYFKKKESDFLKLKRVNNDILKDLKENDPYQQSIIDKANYNLFYFKNFNNVPFIVNNFAQANALYDCYILSWFKKDKPSITDYCKKYFLEEIRAIYLNMNDNKGDDPLFNSNNPVFNVYFKEDSAYLDENAIEIIRHIAARLELSSSYDITINGYSNFYNDINKDLNLAENRIKNIKEELLKFNINDKAILLEAHGSKNINITDDKNAGRKVEIVLDL